METDVRPEPGRHGDGHRWTEAEVRRAGVVVCTPELTAIGYTYCLHTQRLLDVLNKGLDKGLAHHQASVRVVTGRDFLPLKEARIIYRAGGQKYVPSTHIRKANILFVAEISGGQPETSGVRELMKVTKKAVGTEAYVPPYHLIGQMHAEIWEQLADHLEGQDKFLPLTQVSVMPRLVDVESSFDFVAVNRDRVLYIGQSTNSTAEVVPLESERPKKRGSLRRLVGIRSQKGS